MLPPDAPSRFDYLLATMGASLLGGFGVGLLSTIPPLVGAVAGSAVAGVALADGIVRPPG